MKNDEPGHRQQHIVGDQCSFPTGQCKDPPWLARHGRARRRAPSAPPVNTTRIARMNIPRSGSLAKACTLVSTPDRTMNVPDQREPERQNRQQHRPAFQCLALFHHDGRMQQSGRDQPRHEAGVFDRIPEPEPAPAEFIIGPPRPQRDTHSQKQPGGKGPGAYPAPPRRINAPLDQGGDGEREAHRKADIAEVEERRVEGEADILQQRVQVLSIKWRNFKALKRVRRPKNEGKGRPRRLPPER